MTIADSDARVQVEMQRAFLALRQYLVGLLGDLNRDRGTELLSRDAFNMARIDNTVRGMQANLQGLGFGRVLQVELEELARLKDEVLANYRKIDIPDQYTTAAMTEISMLMQGAEMDLIQVQADVSSQLSQVLRRSVVGAMAYGDLLAEIVSILDTTHARALTLISTTLHSFHAQLTFAQGQDTGVKWYVYLGPQDSVTREWCDHWVGHRGTQESIEKTADDWGRDVQPKPAMVWRGGYNCRHEWVPLSDEELDEYPVGPA